MSGISVSDIGLDIMLGESTIENAGKGLFIALSDGIDEILLPRGSFYPHRHNNI